MSVLVENRLHTHYITAVQYRDNACWEQHFWEIFFYILWIDSRPRGEREKKNSFFFYIHFCLHVIWREREKSCLFSAEEISKESGTEPPDAAVLLSKMGLM